MLQVASSQRQSAEAHTDTVEERTGRCAEGKRRPWAHVRSEAHHTAQRETAAPGAAGTVRGDDMMGVDDVALHSSMDVPKKKKKKRQNSADEMSGVDERAVGNDETAGALARLAIRCNNIPMRLDEEERELLAILEGVLNVSEYTDKVDVSRNMYGGGLFSSFAGFGGGVSKKTDLMRDGLREVLSLLSGMYVSSGYKRGKKMVGGRETVDNADFFRRVFEVGRRFKIMNPDSMRTTYGKLLHILQDAQTCAGVIDFNPVAELVTVKEFLSERQAEALLRDPRVLDASISVLATDANEAREQAARKRRAREALLDEYASGSTKTIAMSEADLLLVLDSLADANAYVQANVEPIATMLRYLDELFGPDVTTADSLAITYGKGGSKLTHSHRQQYNFVRCSLVLWNEVQENFFYLWRQAEEDMLNPKNSYRLVNTGQGLARVQSAPKVANSMHQILQKVHRRVGNSWVGLSVVHLGDRDVPNALVFVDKYTQVPRILRPIVHFIEQLPQFRDDEHRNAFLQCVERSAGVNYKELSLDYLKNYVLRDYFRAGFNGSGSDGGSCIDGRLTSSWHWTSLIAKRDYYPLLLLSGFTGFDGNW